MDIPHELRDEFPQEISLIERMIRTNDEFRRLAEPAISIASNRGKSRPPTRFSHGSRSGVSS